MAQIKTGDINTHACGQLAKCPSIQSPFKTLPMSPLPSGPSREYENTRQPYKHNQSFSTQTLRSGPVSADQLVPDDICQQGANLCTNSGKCSGDTEKLEPINLGVGLNVLVLDVLMTSHFGLPLSLISSMSISISITIG